MNRLQREQETLTLMVNLYCQQKHCASELCESCSQLMAYALNRLEKCPMGEQKSTCGQCKIHCYQPAMRDEIRTVMRFAGPRMLFRHPVPAIQHLLDELRNKRVNSTRPR